MSLAPERTVSDVVTDFLSSTPTLEAIASYRLPDDLQQRAHELLEKNRDGTMSQEERHKMEEFRHMDHLMTLIKTKARLRYMSE